MKLRYTFRALIAGLACLLPASTVFAQAQQPAATWSGEDALRIGKTVQQKLGNLVTYGVFDWLTFGDRGTTVVLKGFASRPSLKTDAEAAVKSIAGVDHVENDIEVLPNSPNDDRVRAATYSRIYTQASLRKYNANAGSLARAMGPGGPRAAMMAGGITNSPPIGYHAIHIVVKNGNVMLFGVVLNESDLAMAGMQANFVSGAFSVDNNLIVERSASGKAAK